MRTTFFALTTVAVLAAAACGGSQENNHGGGGTTPAPIGESDAAVSAEAGDAGPDAPTSPVNTIFCSKFQTHVAGRLASGPFDEVYNGSVLSSPSSINGSLAPDGEIEIAQYVTGSGSPGKSGGAIVFPASGPEPGVAYCIDEATFSETNAYADGGAFVMKLLRAHSANVARLGSCANAPAPTDTLAICTLSELDTADAGSICVPGKTHIVGTIGGKAVDVLVSGGSASAMGDRAGLAHLAAGFGDRGLLLLDHERVDAASQYDGTYPTTGLVFLPREASPDGDVLCIGQGSTATYSTAHGSQLTLHVSSLGKCSATTPGAFIDTCVAR